MTKKEYRKALKSPKWEAKRKVILKRDKHSCVKCGCKKGLHVHHKYYLIGKMPWEVPNDCLITLCNICHKKEHEGKNISSFVKKEEHREKVSSRFRDMATEDIDLQKKYDRLKKEGKLPPTTYKPLTFEGKSVKKKTPTKQKKSKKQKKKLG